MRKNRPLYETYNVFLNSPELRDCFKYNEFSEDIEFRKVPGWNEKQCYIGKRIDESDITKLKLYLTTIHQIEPPRSVLGEVCELISAAYSYHPVKQYIEKEKWDGVKRLEEWMIHSFGCQDNVYIREVSQKFLIAAVNRIYNPGCKFDHMLIIEGEQGIGKSTLIEELAHSWYLDTTFDNKDKDLIDAMNSAFIIEISELSGMSKKDVDWMKGFITRKVDRIRLPYAARTKDFRRKSVLVGTYNPSGNNSYLRDDTGNRRFWPVECTSINLSYVKKYKGQLWAEAYEMYKKKSLYYLNSKESLKILYEMHEDREFHGPNQLRVENYLRDIERKSVTTDEILNQCLNIKSTDDKTLGRAYAIMGIQMKKLGWKKGRGEEKHLYFNPKYIKEIKEETKSWEE